jgi:putative membrane protein
MWMLNDSGMGAAGWLVMVLVWVLLIALVVLLVVRLFPARGEGRQPAALAEQPREILKRRLASGDIDLDTYEQLSSKLAAPSLGGKGVV